MLSMKEGNLWIAYLPLLLQGISQVAVSIGEIGLEFNSSSVGINCQVDQAADSSTDGKLVPQTGTKLCSLK